MKELLDFSRGRDFYPAKSHLDEEIQKVVEVDDDLVSSQFSRFMELRQEFQTRKQNVQRNAVEMACMLLELKENGVYNCVSSVEGAYGYSSFSKFCKDVFGLGRDTVSKLLGVADNFCRGLALTTLQENGKTVTKELPSYYLQLPYLNFSFCQLNELRHVDRQYRDRITVSCSVRDIVHLKELYKSYVPEKGTTVEDDLEEWKKRNAEKKERQNVKKNAITFIPARRPDEPEKSVATLQHIEKGVKTGEIPPAQGENSPSRTEILDYSDDFDGDDERDVLTPAQETKIPFESIRAGLLRQLEILLDTDVGLAWKKAVDIFKEALAENKPFFVERRHDLIQSKIECGRLQEELNKLKSGQRDSLHLGASGKLTLKNEKERKEWLKNFKTWGVWIDVPEVGKTYYRYNFENGSSLIVEVSKCYYPYWTTEEWKIKTEVRYTITDENRLTFDNSFPGGVFGVTDWLSKHAKEI